MLGRVPVGEETFLIVQQAGGASDGAWFGNFSPDDVLLYSDAPFPSAVLVVFDDPVFAVGAQVQAGDYGRFLGFIGAFGPDGNAIGAPFSADGESTENADGSALVLGLSAETAIIKAVSFSATVLDRTGNVVRQDFALDFVSCNAPPSLDVPEPARSRCSALA